MIRKAALAAAMLFAASCTNDPPATATKADAVPAATPPSAAAPTPVQPAAPAEPAKPAAPASPKEEAAKIVLPDLSHETGCAILHWTTVAKAWQREEVSWDATTRTLKIDETVRHLDEQGHVRDFGEGKDHLEYDKAGNITFRGGQPGKSLIYRYKNAYDAAGRLSAVEVSSQPAGAKATAFEPYRRYGYDDKGLVDHMDLQIVPHGPLVATKLERDASGKLTDIQWGTNGASAHQNDHFVYDAQGRIVRYERDGLIVPPGRPSDGKRDWTQTWEYGPDGVPVRIDGIDGVDAEEDAHEVTRFTPACAEIGRIWPELYLLPYVPMPAAAPVRFTQGS